MQSIWACTFLASVWQKRINSHSIAGRWQIVVLGTIVDASSTACGTIYIIFHSWAAFEHVMINWAETGTIAALHVRISQRCTTAWPGYELPSLARWLAFCTGPIFSREPSTIASSLYEVSWFTHCCQISCFGNLKKWWKGKTHTQWAVAALQALNIIHKCGSAVTAISVEPTGAYFTWTTFPVTWIQSIAVLGDVKSFLAGWAVQAAYSIL
jgi:hypothetical protein